MTTHGGKRAGAGRPPKNREGKGARFVAWVPQPLIQRLEKWSENHGLSRSDATTEAIRRLVGKG